MRSSLEKPRLRPHERANGNPVAPSDNGKVATVEESMKDISSCLSHLLQIMAFGGIIIMPGPGGRLRNGDLEAKVVIGEPEKNGSIPFSLQKGGMIRHCLAKGKKRAISKERLKAAFERNIRVPVIFTNV